MVKIRFAVRKAGGWRHIEQVIDAGVAPEDNGAKGDIALVEVALHRGFERGGGLECQTFFDTLCGIRDSQEELVREILEAFVVFDIRAAGRIERNDGGSKCRPF